MERKVEEIFDFNNNGEIVKLKVVKNSTCQNCYFNRNCSCIEKNVRNTIGECGICRRKDNTSVNFKQIYNNDNNMEERNVKLSLERAKEWYQKGGDLKEVALQAYTEQELKDNRPHSWKEFCENYPIKPNECYIGSASELHIIDGTQDRSPVIHQNTCTSREEAKAFLALMNLRQLRKSWVGDWEPNWNYCSAKYCIICSGDSFVVDAYYQESKTLSFPTREMANEFRHDFEDLIKQAKPLL